MEEFFICDMAKSSRKFIHTLFNVTVMLIYCFLFSYLIKNYRSVVKMIVYLTK